jgi:hypothetical protein
MPALTARPRRPRDKARAKIDAVSLREFEKGGTARVVRHEYESWISGWHPLADEPWRIVERAEWLLKRSQPSNTT